MNFSSVEKRTQVDNSQTRGGKERLPVTPVYLNAAAAHIYRYRPCGGVLPIAAPRNSFTASRGCSVHRDARDVHLTVHYLPSAALSTSANTISAHLMNASRANRRPVVQSKCSFTYFCLVWLLSSPARFFLFRRTVKLTRRPQHQLP